MCVYIYRYEYIYTYIYTYIYIHNTVVHVHLPFFPPPKWPHVLGHDLGELVEGQVVRLILEGAFAGHGRSFHALKVASLRWWKLRAELMGKK